MTARRRALAVLGRRAEARGGASRSAPSGGGPPPYDIVVDGSGNQVVDGSGSEVIP